MIGIKKLYIFWILHQTTTSDRIIKLFQRCISFESYIKPQPSVVIPVQLESCISFESYIKPQPGPCFDIGTPVVYLLNPTSNHNHPLVCQILVKVVYLLNPTSNHNCSPLSFIHWRLYIFWILHQTTTHRFLQNLLRKLYIFWILHQTTTILSYGSISIRCISFESYIKPQLTSICCAIIWVVYLLNPTSNHNRHRENIKAKLLYIFWILHQTTTYGLPYSN